MDFRNMLKSLTALSEGETKETGKGRVHKGSYGTSYDGDDDKKEKKPEVKRGRGRPKKDAGEDGEVKKYDTKSLHGVFGGGQKPKKEVGKTSKKHSLKEYIEEVSDTKTQLDEGVAEVPKDSTMRDTYLGARHAAEKDAIAANAKNKAGEKAKAMYRAMKANDKKGMAEAEQVSEKYMGFEKVKAAAAKGGAKDPGAVAASIGRKKYGKEKFQKAAAAGKKLGEMDQTPIQIKPASQTTTQVIQKGNKTLGTVNNPQLAQQIKQSIGRGEMTLAGDELTDEGIMGALKSAGSTVAKAGSAVMNKLHPSDIELKKQLQRDQGAQGAQVHGKPSMAIPNNQNQLEQANGASAQRKMGKDGDIYEVGAELTEKAPKGWEGTVKAMKKHKDDIDNPWALAHWMKNKGYKSHKKAEEMTESFKLEDGTILKEGAMKDLVTRFLEDLEHGPKGYNVMTAVELKDRAMAQRIIDKLLQHGERYKRLAGTLKGQLRDAALEEFGFTNYDESLEEADTRPEPELLAPVPSKEAFRTTGLDSKVGEPSAFTPSRVQAPAPKQGMFRAAGALANKLNPFKKLGESTEMKDVQLESWEQQLNSILNEGITVSSSSGQQGSPDSVSITATDADAQTLMGVLRNAGIGGFGAGEQKPEVGYGVVQGGEEDFDGTGTEPQPSPDVVGDDGDMLDMIKKMAGLSGGEVVAVSGEEGDEDYENEEGSDDTALQPADDGEESDDSEDSGEESDDEESDDEEANEGNAFGNEVRQKKEDNIPDSQQRIKTGGQNLPVKEENKGDGNLANNAKPYDKVTQGDVVAGRLGKDEMGGKKEVDESEHTCNECGMYESQCECDHEQVEENWSNDAGGDAMADTEMAKLKALLAMGNDLNKQKRSQTVGNPTKVAFESQLFDWKKLSGIK